MKMDDINENVDLNGYTKEELYKALCICVTDLNKLWASILTKSNFIPFYPTDFLDVIKED